MKKEWIFFSTVKMILTETVFYWSLVPFCNNHSFTILAAIPIATLNVFTYSENTTVNSLWFVLCFAKNKYDHYKKTLQSQANRPLADRCMGYIVNKFEQVGRGGPK